VVLGLAIYATVLYSEIVLLLIAFFYMFSGIFARAAYSWQRRHKASHKHDPSSPPPVHS
jgi:CDP-diacylglycerol--serine O-phosphatidyltransferase